MKTRGACLAIHPDDDQMRCWLKPHPVHVDHMAMVYTPCQQRIRWKGDRRLVRDPETQQWQIVDTMHLPDATTESSAVLQFKKTRHDLDDWDEWSIVRGATGWVATLRRKAEGA